MEGKQNISILPWCELDPTVMNKLGEFPWEFLAANSKTTVDGCWLLSLPILVESQQLQHLAFQAKGL